MAILSALAENVLTLLATDDERAVTIRNLVDVGLFGGVYREIAVRIYDYIDRYKKPPHAHLADILDDKLNSSNKLEAELYSDTIDSIYTASETINKEYVMSQVGNLIRRQSLRAISVDLQKALQRDTEESLDEAEQLLSSANKINLSVFDPGTRLSDPKKALGFLNKVTSAFPTGIDELDKRGLGPTRGEMWLFIANAKSGKTWALIHLAKMAMMQRLKVCHVSLEMGEDRMAQRYMQTLFAMAKRNEPIQILKPKKDSLNRLVGFDDARIMPKLSMDMPDIRARLEAQVKKWGARALDNVLVKQFPTGSLSVRKLDAYLDTVETTERFIPDLLIVDYPDLMEMTKKELRMSLDELYKGLRGLAIRRNIALAIVSQSNRVAAKAKKVGYDNVAEAYSKIAHADVILTHSQTRQEKKLGLARLSVVAARNDEDNITLVLTQAYGIGNYVLESAMMTKGYWDAVPETEEASDED